MKAQMVLNIVIILSTTLISQQALAFNALRGKAFTPEIAKTQQPKELNLDREEIKGRQLAITHSDLKTIMPLNLRNTGDATLVGSEILRNTKRALMQSSMIQDSYLMKTARHIEKEAKMAVSLEATTASQPKIKSLDKKSAKAQKPQATAAFFKPLEHKFKFNLHALQGRARVMYKGFVDSQIEYSAQTDQIRFSLMEKLSGNSTIGLTHDSDRVQSRQYVQYNMTW